MVGGMAEKKIKWVEQVRLATLEHELFWAGSITRNRLSELSNISLPQATLDITAYKNLAPDNIAYDLSQKAYLATPNIRPVLIDVSPHTFLANLTQSFINHISFPYRDIDTQVLRQIYQALISTACVTIDYQSMQTASIKSRCIAPHAFITDGTRWHVRAYDFSSSSFRDFVLGRIKFALPTVPHKHNEEHKWKQKYDQDWNDEVEILLTAHPKLSQQQQQAVAEDYCMSDGILSFPVKKACLIYVVSRLRLFDESSDPAVQQVVLKNKEVVKRLLNNSIGNK